ncbi:uncharacterized protein [Choristoneura fumiferana]|uniref:uncharacterized protein n=1 Tax=Choristoneura fumiferana TaxID=7141 RepID=UPI003D15DD25
MKLVTIIVLFALVLYVRAHHFVTGNVADRTVLLYHDRVEYNAIPFMKRVKYFFYTNPEQKKIVGIQALDTLQSKASINVTAGGVGHSFVNLRMKSERGYGISYDIGIYSSQYYQ